MNVEETVLDDGDLLRDRLLRSLHRNADGHLAEHHKAHKTSIERTHNVAVLFVYTKDDDAFIMHEHYVHSRKPCNYWSWRRIATDEAKRIGREWNAKLFYGVYGWMTATIQITPLRNGDLFLKVDSTGASCVRVAFDPK